MSLDDKLIEDLKRLPRFNVTDHVYGLGHCQGYYIRWRHIVGWIYLIEFAVVKTFDKWSNSANFSTELTYEPKLYRPDIVELYDWMNKICKTDLFDFDRYYDTIKLPFGKGLQNGAS